MIFTTGGPQGPPVLFTFRANTDLTEKVMLHAAFGGWFVNADDVRTRFAQVWPIAFRKNCMSIEDAFGNPAERPSAGRNAS